MDPEDDARAPMSASKRRWLKAGVYMGVGFVIVPFFVAAVSIAITSYRVPEGLRGATHVPALRERVAFALGSASFSALLAPVGILIAVLCGVSLREDERRR